MPRDASAAPCPPPQPRAPAPALLLSPLCSTSTRTGCSGVRGRGSPKQNGHTARTPKALLVAPKAVPGGWRPQKHHQVAGGMSARAARMHTHLVCSARGKEAKPHGVTTSAVPTPPQAPGTGGARYPRVPLGIDESPSLSPPLQSPFSREVPRKQIPCTAPSPGTHGSGFTQGWLPGGQGVGGRQPGQFALRRVNAPFRAVLNALVLAH